MAQEKKSQNQQQFHPAEQVYTRQQGSHNYPQQRDHSQDADERENTKYNEDVFYRSNIDDWQG